MSLDLTDAGANAVVDYLVNTGTRYLGLATDASLTECTDGSYSRQDLNAACPAASSGATSNTSTLAFNTGSDVATHWFIIDHASGAGTLGKIVSGRLPTPITGSYTFAAGEFTIEARGA